MGQLPICRVAVRWGQAESTHVRSDSLAACDPGPSAASTAKRRFRPLEDRHFPPFSIASLPIFSGFFKELAQSAQIGANVTPKGATPRTKPPGMTSTESCKNDGDLNHKESEVHKEIAIHEKDIAGFVVRCLSFVFFVLFVVLRDFAGTVFRLGARLGGVQRELPKALVSTTPNGGPHCQPITILCPSGVPASLPAAEEPRAGSSGDATDRCRRVLQSTMSRERRTCLKSKLAAALAEGKSSAEWAMAPMEWASGRPNGGPRARGPGRS